jgi:quinol monooxygenase YgiN
MLKHVVLLKFKPEISESDIENIEKGLESLPSRIPEIKRYEFGRDILHTERSYDFALISEFEDQEAMQRYQTHPYHFAVLNNIRAACDSIIAVDFT